MDRSVLVLRLFAFLQLKASGRIMAEVEVTLATGQSLMVRAGGFGTCAGPVGGDLTTFEVLMDHEPPKFWSKYGDPRAIRFVHVPKLLLTHHITRSGGIKDITYISRSRPEPATLTMQVSAPAERRKVLETLLGSISGVNIDTITLQRAPF